MWNHPIYEKVAIKWFGTSRCHVSIFVADISMMAACCSNKENLHEYILFGLSIGFGLFADATADDVKEWDKLLMNRQHTQKKTYLLMELKIFINMPFGVWRKLKLCSQNANTFLVATIATNQQFKSLWFFFGSNSMGTVQYSHCKKRIMKKSGPAIIFSLFLLLVFMECMDYICQKMTCAQTAHIMRTFRALDIWHLLSLSFWESPLSTTWDWDCHWWW